MFVHGGGTGSKDARINMPPITTARSGHACTILETAEGRRLLIVAGGDQEVQTYCDTTNNIFIGSYNIKLT